MKLNLCRLAALSAATIALSFGAASAAEPTAKWCSGVKIAAFPGGPQGGVFANNVYNGFRQDELDLGHAHVVSRGGGEGQRDGLLGVSAALRVHGHCRVRLGDVDVDRT